MIFVSGPVFQSQPNACLIDITPPTFDGVQSLTINPNGSITVNWNAATDVSAPIYYEIYIQKDTPTGLFSVANRTLATTQLTAILFYSDSELLIPNTDYYIGVRARDASGNLDTNNNYLSTQTTGVVADSIAALVGRLEVLGRLMSGSVPPNVTGEIRKK